MAIPVYHLTIIINPQAEALQASKAVAFVISHISSSLCPAGSSMAPLPHPDFGQSERMLEAAAVRGAFA